MPIIIKLSSLSLYQWAVLLFATVMILKAWSHYFRGEKSWRELILWHLLFGAFAVLSLYPQLTDYFAQAIGLRAGANALIFLALAILFYLVLRLVDKVEEQERKITELVRRIALEKKVSDE